MALLAAALASPSMIRVAPNIYKTETAKGTRYVVRLQVEGRDIWRRGFLTKDQAEQYRNTLLFHTTEEKHFPGRLPAPTLHDYAKTWLAACALRDLRHTTVRSYTYNLRQHLMPSLGELSLDEITRQHIVTLLQEKQKDGYSRDALRLMIAPLSVMYGDAADQGLIDPNYNPCLRIGRIIKVKRQKIVRAFSDDERKAILAAAKALRPDHLDLIEVLFGLGLRVGEAIALESGDLQDKRLAITRTYTDGELHDTPKNGQTRLIEVPPKIWKILTRRCFARRLFPGEGNAGYLAYRSWRRHVWDPIIKEAKVSHLTPHATRHTYATLHLKDGCSMQWLSYQLGHSSIKVTVDIYGHLAPVSR